MEMETTITAVYANRIALPSRDENGGGERGKRRPLPAVVVEVRRIEPALKGRVDGRPLAVDHRVPRSVAVPALVDPRLPEDALVREAKPLRGAARRGIEGVALPLVAPVAERERALHHQVHRLGRGDGPLQFRRVVDVADFDGTCGRIDPEVARPADRRAGRELDD